MQAFSGVSEGESEQQVRMMVNHIAADLAFEEYKRKLNTNLRGIWLCMKYELQQMRKQENGTICKLFV